MTLLVRLAASGIRSSATAKITHVGSRYAIHCVTLTFAERNRLALSLSGNNPLSAN